MAGKYFELLDQHLNDLMSGRATEMMELNDIAKQLFVSHKYLIEIIREEFGEHPCHFYVQKILDTANRALTTTQLPVNEIALQLTYDPSNFNKFYKKYMGLTPGQYREKYSSAK